MIAFGFPTTSSIRTHDILIIFSWKLINLRRKKAAERGGGEEG